MAEPTAATPTVQLVRVAMEVLRSFGPHLEQIGLDTTPLQAYVRDNQGIDGLSDEERSTALTIADSAPAEPAPGVVSRVATAAAKVVKRKGRAAAE